MSREDGLKLIAIYHFVMAGLWLLGALAPLLMLIVPLAMQYMPPEATVMLFVMVGLLFVLLGGLAVLYLFTGLGLLKYREWARWVAIVLAILGALGFPVGTVIGVLILWFLLRDDVQAAFRGDPA
jgi:hypothetical protein